MTEHSTVPETTPETDTLDFVPGDLTELSIPAHSEALLSAGEALLTRAFRAFGSLSRDNRIVGITHWEPCPGGSTGQKLFLSVVYDKPQPELPTDLFVKFSRDFSNPARDRGRYEMEAEVRFAGISRLPGFPIRVPRACFADYHGETGTGVLITERIPFGRDGIEPLREKCLDYELEDPLAYYRAIVTALARLAAAHKSGRLSAEIEARFPFDARAAVAADPIPYDERQLRDLIARYADFAERYPRLLPDNVADPAFFAELDRQAGRFLRHEPTIKQFLQSDPDLIALSHWNANIDNAWFWRDASGAKQCGLMDWGRVRQMNVAYALWGCLSGAGLEVWDEHLRELLELFVRELRYNGGPRIDPAELELHLELYTAMMGLAWLLEAPEKVLHRLPEAPRASGPTDPLFRNNESARNQLHVSTAFLNFWQTHDFGASLDRLLERAIGR